MSRLEILKSLKSLSDFAKVLGYPPKSLSYILYKIPDSLKYHKFNIPKSNGEFREILAPIEKLKLLQKRLASLLTDCYDEVDVLKNNKKSLSHGFRKKHSIVTNALNHRNKRYVFNIDLQDFFPSINFGRVQGFFIKDNHFQLDPKIATIIAQIVCHNGRLPQGSPCSPIISNLIGQILDYRMVYIAQKTNCTYTRYADDLTFSTNKKDFPDKIAIQSDDKDWNVSEYLEANVKKAGFSINHSKTSMQYRTSRQVTTGLIVNKKVNIKREYYKKIRSCCYSLFKNDSFYFAKQKRLLLEGSDSNSNKLCNDQPKGSISQLEGFLSFIYHVKRPHDNNKPGTRYHHPNSITKLYRQFLFYKHFFILEKPLIICEGKTDVVYLKCALKNLYKQYNELIEYKEDKYLFKIRFLPFSNTFKDVFAISEGWPGLISLAEKYEKYMSIYKGKGKKYPVILILDTDDGGSQMVKHFKINGFNNPFIKLIDNLYIVFISNEKGLEIENLFDKKVLNIKLDGKKFNSKKLHGDHSEYGKHIFAEKVIKPYQKYISFNRFMFVFGNLTQVLIDYKKTN